MMGVFFGILFGVGIIAVPSMIIWSEKQKEQAVDTLKREQGEESLTPEEKQLKMVLQTIISGQATFYRKNYFEEKGKPNDYYFDTNIFTLFVTVKEKVITGSFQLSESKREIFTFKQSRLNKRDVSVVTQLFRRFFTLYDDLPVIAVQSLVDYNWGECAVEELTLDDKWNHLGELEEQMKPIKEKFLLLSSKEEELDFETKHMINTLMNKDIPRLVESFLQLKGEEREKQKRETIEILSDVDQKFEQYVEKFKDRKLNKLEVAKKIIEKRLGKE